MDLCDFDTAKSCPQHFPESLPHWVVHQDSGSHSVESVASGLQGSVCSVGTDNVGRVVSLHHLPQHHPERVDIDFVTDEQILNKMDQHEFWSHVS